MLFVLAGPVRRGAAQDQGPFVPPGDLKRLSVEELMNLEVTSVSRRPERLAETASAVQVIRQDDIRRSGATSLPEALRLAPNLQVARLNSYAWIVSARGFNAVYSNKLLVMIDGRTVYSPLFAGVLWDVQNVLLEDVAQVEVVSGPGGTLWGANAVNGVINVLTRSAEDTQGLVVSGAVGSFLNGWGAARYGGRIGTNLFYRVYAQHFDRERSVLPGGPDPADAWHLTQGGFRLDWLPSAAGTLTLQGDLYGGTEHTAPSTSGVNGQHVMATWTHAFSAGSNLQVQTYFDRTWRHDVPSTITDELETYDLDLQHRFHLGRRHQLVWGAGYRLMRSDIRTGTTAVGYLPPERTLQLFSGFVQDEIALVRDRLALTVGTKLEHKPFSGLDVLPSTRLAWTPGHGQTIWSAVSRAVRSPSRIDVDLHITAVEVPPGAPNVAGGPAFDSETVVAYELGYRVRPAASLSLALTAFYNRYDDLYSVEPLPGTQTYQIQNGSEGDAWGAELSGAYQPAGWWRLRGGYTYVRVDLRSKPGHTFDTSILGNDPRHQFLVQSMLDLPGGFRLDVVGRYVSERPAPAVAGYFTFDTRLAWEAGGWELSVVGRNLARDPQPEFGSLAVPRNVYGKVTWRL